MSNAHKYTQAELDDIKPVLKDICDVYLNALGSADFTSTDKPMEEFIILALQKYGYRIVKVK